MSWKTVAKTGILLMLAMGTPVVASGFPEENQIVLLSVQGDDNVLRISQDYLGSAVGKPNQIDLEVIGDRNGGAQPWSTRLSASLGLEPGVLMQVGWGNRLMLQVHGSDNVFATNQQGQSNVINGIVSGFGNQTAIQQTGTGNSVAFSQSGQRNTIVVSQSTQ